MRLMGYIQHASCAVGKQPTCEYHIAMSSSEDVKTRETYQMCGKDF